MIDYEKDYYEIIVKKENPNSFINYFDIAWKEYLNSFKLTYNTGKQLYIGNRLRPILCCWGYMHCYDLNDIDSFKKIAKIAVSLEAVHKASVIIDDVIDGDTKRRGEECFHIEFGEKETTFFAVCLLSGAIKNINKTLSSIITNSHVLSEAINILCDTITDMCIGAIKEINTNTQDRCNLSRIKEIINSETVTLLKNSFLLGYLSTDKYDTDLIDAFTNIGSKCGYIFQIMNDLEPFCNPQYILSHKGNLNSDCLRSRKNVVIPYLCSVANKTDCITIQNILDNESNYSVLKNLFDKYSIRDLIFQDMNELKSNIYTTIENLPSDKVDRKWKKVFPIFVNNLIEYCVSILDGVPKKW